MMGNRERRQAIQRHLAEQRERANARLERVEHGMSDDELLASVLRKFLTSDEYVNWGDQRSKDYPFWVTIDGTAAITADELAAIERTQGDTL